MKLHTSDSGYVYAVKVPERNHRSYWFKYEAEAVNRAAWHTDNGRAATVVR